MPRRTAIVAQMESILEALRGIGVTTEGRHDTVLVPSAAASPVAACTLAPSRAGGLDAKEVIAGMAAAVMRQAATPVGLQCGLCEEVGLAPPSCGRLLRLGHSPG